jgi:hypothetical protein
VKSREKAEKRGKIKEESKNNPQKLELLGVTLIFLAHKTAPVLTPRQHLLDPNHAPGGQDRFGLLDPKAAPIGLGSFGSLTGCSRFIFFDFPLPLFVFRLEFVDQFGQVVAGFDVFGDFFDGEPHDF